MDAKLKTKLKCEKLSKKTKQGEQFTTQNI